MGTKKELNSKSKILILGDVNSIHLQKWINSLKVEFELTVFSLNPLEKESSVFEGVNIYSNNEQTTNKRNKLSYFKSIRRFKKIYKELNPDFVHAHYASSYGLLGVLLRPKKLFVSIWGSDVFEFPKRSFIHKVVFKWILRKADRLFSTSEQMKCEVNKYTNKEVYVIPFGIDVNLFSPKLNEHNSDEIIIGTVKALENVYGIDVLIQSFSKFNKLYKKSKLIIYGKGSKENELKELVSRLKIEKQVSFEGFVKNQEVPNVISSMDIFCVLSRQESFGVSVIEASSCGVPIIATNVGGLPEVVLNNKTGFLVSNQDEIVKKMILLANDPSLRKEMGISGRKFVKENYVWEKNVNTMVSFYQ